MQETLLEEREAARGVVGGGKGKEGRGGEKSNINKPSVFSKCGRIRVFTEAALLVQKRCMLTVPVLGRLTEICVDSQGGYDSLQAGL